MTGRHKHKWTWVLRYDRDYFGKHGFYRPNRREVRAINLIQLKTLVENLEREGRLKTMKDKPFINLKELGVDKLIARGRINRPILCLLYTSDAADDGESVDHQDDGGPDQSLA